MNQNKREKGREPVLLHFHPSKNTGARGGREESGDSDGRATLTSKAAAHARSMEERNSVAQRKDDLQNPMAEKDKFLVLDFVYAYGSPPRGDFRFGSVDPNQFWGRWGELGGGVERGRWLWVLHGLARGVAGR
jgi:hypothetical protein